MLLDISDGLTSCLGNNEILHQYFPIRQQMLKCLVFFDIPFSRYIKRSTQVIAYGYFHVFHLNKEVVAYQMSLRCHITLKRFCG